MTVPGRRARFGVLMACCGAGSAIALSAATVALRAGEPGAAGWCLMALSALTCLCFVSAGVAWACCGERERK